MQELEASLLRAYQRSALVSGNGGRIFENHPMSSVLPGQYLGKGHLFSRAAIGCRNPDAIRSLTAAGLAVSPPLASRGAGLAASPPLASGEFGALSSWGLTGGFWSSQPGGLVVCLQQV